MRKLTDAGIEEFRRFILKRRADGKLAPPRHLLDDTRYSEVIPGSASVEQRHFDSKLAFGQYINSQVKGRISVQLLRRSVGIWAWLTLFFIDEVIPPGKTALRPEKYLSSATDDRSFDKHLLYFPWKMISLFGDEASWMLYTPLREDTKFIRELANSYRRNVSASYIRLARFVFFDEEKRIFKRGATTGNSNKPGTLRHLDRITGQFDVTYDVFGMDPADFARILPKEFKRWLPK